MTGRESMIVLGLMVSLFAPSLYATPIALGPFKFDSRLFGVSVDESDGGVDSRVNWLNVSNADPGNPAYLTGAHFDTGIANLGLGSATLAYVVHYDTPIFNYTGNDAGIVSARFSLVDSFSLSVSTDGGATFSNRVEFGPATAVGTDVVKNYYYVGGGPYVSTLFVQPIDFADFGVEFLGRVNAIKIEPRVELDLIRIAGFLAGEDNTGACGGCGSLEKLESIDGDSTQGGPNPPLP